MLSIGQVTEALEETSRQLEELVDQITAAGDQQAHAEATFKAEFAKARLVARAEALGSKITVDEVEDRATGVTQSQRLAYLLATNQLTVLREALRAKQAQLDALRTLSSSFRAAGG